MAEDSALYEPRTPTKEGDPLAMNALAEILVSKIDWDKPDPLMRDLVILFESLAGGEPLGDYVPQHYLPYVITLNTVIEQRGDLYEIIRPFLDAFPAALFIALEDIQQMTPLGEVNLENEWSDGFIPLTGPLEGTKGGSTYEKLHHVFPYFIGREGIAREENTPSSSAHNFLNEQLTLSKYLQQGRRGAIADSCGLFSIGKMDSPEYCQDFSHLIKPGDYDEYTVIEYLQMLFSAGLQPFHDREEDRIRLYLFDDNAVSSRNIGEQLNHLADLIIINVDDVCTELVIPYEHDAPFILIISAASDVLDVISRRLTAAFEVASATQTQLSIEI